jgi:hypothetical protein
MIETEVETLRAGGTRVEQKKQGTFHLHFARLQEEYARLMKSGASSETLRDALVELLRSFENERLNFEDQIHKAQRVIDYSRAMQRACSQHSNLIVAVLTRRAGEWERGDAKATDSGGNGVGNLGNTLADGSPRLTEEEARNTLCVCACVDAADAASCKCLCHTRGYCDNDSCIVCKEPRKAAEDLKATETAGRRRAPAPKKKVPKKAAKKKTTRKKAPRKKAAKKKDA